MSRAKRKYTTKGRNTYMLSCLCQPRERAKSASASMTAKPAMRPTSS